MSDSLSLFRPWKDSVGAHLTLFFVPWLAYLSLFWFFLSEQSGSPAFDTINLTAQLLLLSLIPISMYTVYWFVKRDQSINSPIIGLSYGSIISVLISIPVAFIAFLVLRNGLGLDFAGSFAFSAIDLFWFLVLFAPLSEEILFRGVINPMGIAVARITNDSLRLDVSDNIQALIVFFMSSSLFAGFHWFAYYRLSEQTATQLAPLLFFAFIFGLIVSIGNYLLKSIMFGVTLHVLHNLSGYLAAYGMPVIETWQYAGTVLILLGGLALLVFVYITKKKIKPV